MITRGPVPQWIAALYLVRGVSHCLVNSIIGKLSVSHRWPVILLRRYRMRFRQVLSPSYRTDKGLHSCHYVNQVSTTTFDVYYYHHHLQNGIMTIYGQMLVGWLIY